MLFIDFTDSTALAIHLKMTGQLIYEPKNSRRGTLPGRVPLLTGISSVERLLYRFPEIIERAYLELAPQHIVTYLIELAGAFNSYYAKYQILGSEGEKYRLALTKAVATVLKNGLQILAIPVLEKM